MSESDHLHSPEQAHPSSLSTTDIIPRDGNSVHLGNGDSSTSTPSPQNPSIVDDNVTGSSTEALATGISTMLASVIQDFDGKAVDASISQDKLCSAIDRLTGELDQLLEDAPLPFIMQHAAKLSNVRKRVSSLNLILRSIQCRLDNIDRMFSVGQTKEKSNVGGPR